jgi:membrane fusion protein, multidrug efflux system
VHSVIPLFLLTSPARLRTLSLRGRVQTTHALALGAAALLSAWLPAPASGQTTAPAPVVATEARLEFVAETLPLTGTVTARQQATLSPRASGLVASVQVDAGSYVEPGARLVSLDSALAELAAEAAAADLAEAQARHTESERLLEEARRLLTKNSIPETEVMNRSANASIAAAAARRADVITQKLTEAGEWVSTGMPVLQLVGLEGARIDVQVPQERLAALSINTPVEFAVDTAPDKRLAGHITALVPVSNPNTRTALVRIEPLDRDVVIPPGKSVRVTFRIRSDRPVLTVPRDALIRRADGTVNIWIATASGEQWQASVRRVDLGRTYGDQVEILAGLEPGQRVIIRGNETVREGQVVRLIEASN